MSKEYIRKETRSMNLLKKGIAECLGTLVLVFIACGVGALFGGSNLVATALAFGLSVVAMAYSIGKISGCHINPAVSVAMLINKRITLKEFIVYIVSQFIGAILGAALLYVVFKQFTFKGSEIINVTGKGNLVAVISNGTAVLGLGDIGAEASKPVMEGKGLLFKIFADINVFDIEIAELEKLKSKLGDTFQKLVQMILELKNKKGYYYSFLVYSYKY